MAVGHEFDVVDAQIAFQFCLKLFVFCAHVGEPVRLEYRTDFLYIFLK